jgi:hypothetical protein
MVKPDLTTDPKSSPLDAVAVGNDTRLSLKGGGNAA